MTSGKATDGKPAKFSAVMPGDSAEPAFLPGSVDSALEEGRLVHQALRRSASQEGRRFGHCSHDFGEAFVNLEDECFKKVPKEVMKVLELLDLDGDGRLFMWELQSNARILSDLREAADQDGSGSITLQEINEAIDLVQRLKKDRATNCAELRYEHMPEAVKGVLETWDADKSGSVGVSELVQAAEAQKRMKDENRLMKQLVVGAGIVILILMGANLGLSFTAVELAKESHVSNGELVGTDDKQIKVFPGATMTTLGDLPKQSRRYHEQMVGISVPVAGESYKHYKVSGYFFHNKSYMVINTTLGHAIIVAGGLAFVQDSATGKVLQATTPGRRLSGAATAASAPLAGSWEEMVDRYHREIAAWRETAEATEGQRAWRRLDMGDEAGGLADMYRWFGALISSDVTKEEARALAEDALETAYEDYDVAGLRCQAYEASLAPKPPNLPQSGLLRFTLEPDDAQKYGDAGLGERIYQYVDLLSMRWKIATRVAVSDRSLGCFYPTPNMNDTRYIPSDIQVSEFQGNGRVHRYSMKHPACWPELYGDEKFEEDDTGEAMAARLLESAEFEDRKDSCRNDRNPPPPQGERFHPVDATFRCEDGVFIWKVGSWSVEAAADGTILAFLYNGGTLRLAVRSIAYGGDEDAHPDLSKAFFDDTIFRGCSQDQKRSRQLDAPAALRRLQAAAQGPKRPRRSLAPALRRLDEVAAMGQAPGTQWCGAGTSLETTPCPDEENLDDLACRRHDHGFRSVSVVIGVKSGCDIDDDLLEGTGNVLVHAVFGNWGVATAWGCFDDGWEYCWRWKSTWWGGYYAYEQCRWTEITKYGPWRYNDIQKRHGYADYNNRAAWPDGTPQICAGDLPWTR